MPPALTDIGLPKDSNGTCLTESYPFAFASASFRNTWFSTEGLSNVVKSNRGSGAGTPLADIIFAIAIARVLGTLKHNIAQEGYSVSIGKADHIVDFEEVPYHDDLVIPSSAPASEIVSRTAAVASLAYSVFATYGFTLNFSLAKRKPLYILQVSAAEPPKNTNAWLTILPLLLQALYTRTSGLSRLTST